MRFQTKNFRHPLRRRLAALLRLCFLLAALPAFAQSQTRRELLVQGRDGASHAFAVEIAATDAERAKGLMFRRELAVNAGMLFDFATPQPVTMWMKNTLLPLDMLFVAEDGRVVNIAERTVPGSLAAISSDEPVRFVIEINGGTASRLRLRAGDRVVKGLAP